MITTIAKFRIIPGREDEVVPALVKLADAVREEPGTLTYMVFLPDSETRECAGQEFASSPEPPAGQVTFVESYTDWDAFCDHVNGPNFQTFITRYGDCFEPGSGFPHVESTFLNSIGGFACPAEKE